MCDSHMGNAVSSVRTVHVHKGTQSQLLLADGFCCLSQDAILGFKVCPVIIVITGQTSNPRIASCDSQQQVASAVASDSVYPSVHAQAYMHRPRTVNKLFTTQGPRSDLCHEHSSKQACYVRSLAGFAGSRCADSPGSSSERQSES